MSVTEMSGAALALRNRRGPTDGRTRPGLVSIVLVSAWGGLVAGLLEVGTFVLRKQIFDANYIYDTSRHFTWLTPATNCCAFMVMGVLGWGLVAVWPGWLGATLRRLLCALVLLPMVLVGFSQLYALACFILTLGIAAPLVGLFERKPAIFRRLVVVSFPIVVGAVAILAAVPFGRDWLKQWRERARPLPVAGSPNVLLLVMDTVAAGHSSLYGYERATNLSLEEFAERGIRFDAAQAGSSWTLPSHSVMFTGRWLHELSAGWMSPLDKTYPTIAEYLGGQGYATAGFVANVRYCASDSGLERGFTEYHDYIFPGLTPFKMPVLLNRGLMGIQPTLEYVVDQAAFTWLRPVVNEFWRLFVDDKKHAAVVNRQLLNWLSTRPEPERPFFAFLNYFDAHRPYRVPAGRIHRFGTAPAGSQRGLIQNWGDLDKTQLSAEEIAFVMAAYDDCIADLDEQIGKLLDELQRRRVLDRTWVIVTADHGESFGEHPGVYCHGSSLYQSEVRVPLLIIPPGGFEGGLIVKETVCLRDLAATIADVVGLRASSPFPGNSLARYWDRVVKMSGERDESPTAALAEVVPDDPLNHDSLGLPIKTWPLAAVHAERWSYIRREGKLHEELYDLRGDPGQRWNLVDEPSARVELDRLRETMSRMTDGPLVPSRFRR